MKRHNLLVLLLVMSIASACANSGGALTTVQNSEPAQTSETPVPAEKITPTPIPTPTPEPEPFPGKIAFVNNGTCGEMEYRTALDIQKEYGEEKIVCEVWPANFMSEQGQIIDIVGEIGQDPDVKVIILNQTVPGANAAIDKLKETRDDIFVVYCTPHENPEEVAKRADLILIPDELAMGSAMVQKAYDMGAKTFVHYSFPRHMSQIILSARRELIKQECANLDIQFIDATSPDPTSDAGVAGAQQFILEDVPKMISKYGKDTAFFSTNCAMQIPLIKSVVDFGAIYPQPCCPSPYHGFPSALGLEWTDNLSVKEDLKDTVNRINDFLAEKDMLGRVSTWPIPSDMLLSALPALYGIKWLNGEVQQKESIDLAVLEECLNEYTGVECELSPYTDSETGITYPNFLMVREGYITFNGQGK